MSAPGNVLPWVRLWRVEHSLTGHGPFHMRLGNGAPDRPWAPSARPWDMPNPMWDQWHHVVEGFNRVGWFPFGPESRFAFSCRLALRRWVDAWAAKDAADMGYWVRMVAVPQEAHVRSRHQAIYDASRALTLRTVSFARLLSWD